MDAIVIGDGPGGLSAALFLAKNGLKVTVYGQDKTAMHWALLKNYLGIQEIHGSELQKIGRSQVLGFGATIVDSHVDKVAKVTAGFEVTLAGGATASAPYLILSEGKSPKLAQQLGLTFDPENGVKVDLNGKTELDGVYAVGRQARPGRSQAIISAGDGAAAAIDILSRIRGEAFCDWDSPPEEKG
ncbi:MAG: FAD-dependent oxidoreductase [Polyangiaceae bacterium]|nr:FAD-dependent oxidoreductase [Polyangiaceae bacterium]